MVREVYLRFFESIGIIFEDTSPANDEIFI